MEQLLLVLMERFKPAFLRCRGNLWAAQLACAALIFVLASGCAAIQGGQAEPTPLSGISMPPEDERESWLRLDNVPQGADQVEFGAEVYRLVCKSCHGDRGQGLTEDWIAQWNPDDQNCWQSKCHAENHPEDGFKLPRYVPPVTGEEITGRFDTAAELYRFVSLAMPWHAPGSLTSEEYWYVTAYLLEINGVELGDTVLDEGSAPLIELR